MDAFGLFKYWRSGGTPAVSAAGAGAPPAVADAAGDASADDTDNDSRDNDDEGPFFDLEFTVPEEECGCGVHDDEVDVAGSSVNEGDEEEEGTTTDDEGSRKEEQDLNFTVSSEGSCGDLPADPSLPLSPSDDLFFRGGLVPLESSTPLVFHHAAAAAASHPKPHILPVSLLKTKLQVLMLGLRRPKQASAAAPSGEPLGGSADPAVLPSPKHQRRRNKLLTVRFKVEEVPIVSLFTRDNSSRSTGSSSHERTAKQLAGECGGASPAPAGEKTRPPKELVQKYLNRIKPPYVRVPKRSADKLGLSGRLSAEGLASQDRPAAQVPATTSAPVHIGEEQTTAAPDGRKAVQKSAAPGGGNLPAGLRVACKHLGKSRSASAVVAAVPSPPPALARRRDDSLLQQQDGIQSAIAHCKMSFNASEDGASSSPPPSSRSNSFHGRATDPSGEDRV